MEIQRLLSHTLAPGRPSESAKGVLETRARFVATAALPWRLLPSSVSESADVTSATTDSK
jgi:hypothetical protein